MIKPLLRTIPTLSGNVKLACTLLDYNKINTDTFETNIRGAHIYPLSSQLFQKSVQANLLNSSWEYDLKRFYSAYSDTFFNSEFDIQKTEMVLLDTTETLYPRNTDFEYGVKRVSFVKSGNQYACFAPIYIDNVNDIPGYFLLTCTFNNGSQTITKHIKINIGGDSKNSDYNFIYKYLYNYLKKIDNNVIFIPNDGTLIYNGIDLINGGFAKKIDNTVSTIFNTKMPMQLFDYTVTNGFRRNNLCIKQVLPLCFYFNIDGLLNESERFNFSFADITFSGNYYDASGIIIDWYDFSVDYDTYAEKIITLNKNTGDMEISTGYEQNIMDINYPSMNDKWIVNYKYANKLSNTLNRWKLKYSDDDTPYILNMSYAFSANQNSNKKYGQFPNKLTNQTAICEVFNNTKYNLVLPLGNYTKLYNKLNLNYNIKMYQNEMNNYVSNWFSIVFDKEFESFKNTTKWADTDNGYTYYNGILYNLNYIYNNLPDNTKKIDKFAVLFYPDVSSMYKYTDEYYKTEVNYVKYALAKTNEITGIKAYDVFKPQDVYTTVIGPFSLFPVDTTSSIIQSDNYTIENDVFFEKLDDNSFEEEFYVNLRELGYEFFTLSSVYKYNDLGLGDLPRFDLFKRNVNLVKSYRLNTNKYNNYIIQYNDVVDDIIDIADDISNGNSYSESISFAANLEILGNRGKSLLFKLINYFHPTGNITIDGQQITFNHIAFESADVYYSNSSVKLSTDLANKICDKLGVQRFTGELPLVTRFFSIKTTISLFDDISYDNHPTIKETIDFNNIYINYNYGYNQNAADSYTNYYESWFCLETTEDSDIINDLSKLTEDFIDRATCWTATGPFMMGNSINPNVTFYSDFKIDLSNYITNTLGIKSGINPVFYDVLIDSFYYKYAYKQDASNISLPPVFEPNGIGAKGVELDNILPIYRGDMVKDYLLDLQYNTNIHDNIENNLYININSTQEYDFKPTKLNQDINLNGKFNKTYSLIVSTKDNFIDINWFNPNYYSIDPLIMSPYYISRRLDQANITNTNSVEYQRYTDFVSSYNTFCASICKKLLGKTGNIQEYLYYPALTYSDKIVATNVVIRKQKEFDASIETNLYSKNPDGSGEIDNNVLYTLTTIAEKTHEFWVIITTMEILDFFRDIFTGIGVYKQSKVLSYKDNNGGIEIQNVYYEYNKITDISNINFDSIKNVFTDENDEEIVLTMKLPVRKTTETDIKNIVEKTGSDFKDSFIFRPFTDMDYDIAYHEISKINGVNQTDIDTVNKTNNNVNNQDKDIRIFTDDTSLLYPCFKSPFIEDKSSNLINEYWDVQRIRECTTSDRENATKAIKFYRYSASRYTNAAFILTNNTELESSKFKNEKITKYTASFVKSVGFINNSGNSDFSKYNINVFDDESTNTRYGYYLLQAKLNNSKNMFNILGINSDTIIPDDAVLDDYLVSVMNINYINNVNIINTPLYICEMFKQLVPFLKIDLLTPALTISTLVKPTTFNLLEFYNTKLVDTTNPEALDRLLVLNNNFTTNKYLTLNRYTDSVIPYIVKTTSFNNLYNYKYKQVKTVFLDNDNLRSLGDIVYESTEQAIFGTEPTFGIYNQIGNIRADSFTPYEYKFFNKSRLLNTEVAFSIDYPNKVSYESILKLESFENTLNVFKQYIKNKIHTKDFEDDKILFLYKKYKAEYDTIPAGVSLDGSTKLFKLKYKFTLL